VATCSHRCRPFYPSPPRTWAHDLLLLSVQTRHGGFGEYASRRRLATSKQGHGAWRTPNPEGVQPPNPAETLLRQCPFMGKRRHPGKVGAFGLDFVQNHGASPTYRPQSKRVPFSGKRQPPGSPEDSFPRRRGPARPPYASSGGSSIEQGNRNGLALPAWRSVSIAPPYGWETWTSSSSRPTQPTRQCRTDLTRALVDKRLRLVCASDERLSTHPGSRQLRCTGRCPRFRSGPSCLMASPRPPCRSQGDCRGPLHILASRC
jgi:hypothetical protein